MADEHRDDDYRVMSRFYDGAYADGARTGGDLPFYLDMGA